MAAPALTALGYGDGADPAKAVWSGHVRLIGAGIIAVGGLWTVGSLARPILKSVGSALASARKSRSGMPSRNLPRPEQDLPITWVGGAALALALPLAWLFGEFASDATLGGLLIPLVAAATVFSVLFGFLMAAACCYLAGLLGSSSSPISGIGILTMMSAAALLPLLLGRSAGPEGDRFVIAMALVVASVIVTMASIANDNLQDLKTGQLVDATAWRQQVALGIGVLTGAMVIAPVLSPLYEAYGFVGAMPRAGMEAASAMAAPQAALTSQIASGIVHGTLPWAMVLIGAGLGGMLVVVESRLRRHNLTFPTLTVGIGMYLPLSVEVTFGIGGVLGCLVERRLRGRARANGDDEGAASDAGRRRGVLLSSGLLVGESLIGIVLAGADALAGRSAALALVEPGNSAAATWLGLIVFVAGLVVFARLVADTPGHRSGAPAGV